MITAKLIRTNLTRMSYRRILQLIQKVSLALIESVLRFINGNNSVRYRQNSVRGNQNDVLNFNLSPKDINFGHLNVQGTCGQNMSKFSQLKAILTAPENSALHIFGINESKLKEHKLSKFFKTEGFQMPFRKDNENNCCGGIMVYVRNGINARPRDGLETNGISCIWLEMTPEKGKSFSIGNMYRPPDSRIEFSDRFESFIDYVFRDDKEVILLGDLNKNLLNETDSEWANFMTS